VIVLPQKPSKKERKSSNREKKGISFILSKKEQQKLRKMGKKYLIIRKTITLEN
jgi:hypothetical protein